MWPRWVVYAILPIGLALLVLRAGEAAIDDLAAAARDGLVAATRRKTFWRSRQRLLSRTELARR